MLGLVVAGPPDAARFVAAFGARSSHGYMLQMAFTPREHVE
jgi:hypothetical protein